MIKDLAIQRIYILFRLGVEAVRRGEYTLAQRYGELIRRLAMRARVKIPKGIKRWICKNCNVIMVPGINCRVRTRSEGRVIRLVTRCLVCGWIHRYEFRRKRHVEVQRNSVKAQEDKGSTT